MPHEDVDSSIISTIQSFPLISKRRAFYFCVITISTPESHFPAFKVDAERIVTTYHEALCMSAAESAQWDCIRAVGSEAELVEISLDVFHPEVIERTNAIVHL